MNINNKTEIYLDIYNKISKHVNTIIDGILITKIEISKDYAITDRHYNSISSNINGVNLDVFVKVYTENKIVEKQVKLLVGNFKNLPVQTEQYELVLNRMIANFHREKFFGFLKPKGLREVSQREFLDDKHTRHKFLIYLPEGRDLNEISNLINKRKNKIEFTIVLKSSRNMVLKFDSLYRNIKIDENLVNSFEVSGLNKLLVSLGFSKTESLNFDLDYYFKVVDTDDDTMFLCITPQLVVAMVEKDDDFSLMYLNPSKEYNATLHQIRKFLRNYMELEPKKYDLFLSKYAQNFNGNLNSKTDLRLKAFEILKNQCETHTSDLILVYYKLFNAGKLNNLVTSNGFKEEKLGSFTVYKSVANDMNCIIAPTFILFEKENNQTLINLLDSRVTIAKFADILSKILGVNNEKNIVQHIEFYLNRRNVRHIKS